jgi:hypothetical protein
LHRLSWRRQAQGEVPARQLDDRLRRCRHPRALDCGEFTVLAGAKRHRLEPWAYLRDVLLRLSAGETDLESLLPDQWAASHPEHVLEHRLDESRRKAARQKARRERRRAKARPKA